MVAAAKAGGEDATVKFKGLGKVVASAPESAAGGGLVLHLKPLKAEELGLQKAAKKPLLDLLTAAAAAPKSEKPPAEPGAKKKKAP